MNTDIECFLGLLTDKFLFKTVDPAVQRLAVFIGHQDGEVILLNAGTDLPFFTQLFQVTGYLPQDVIPGPVSQDVVDIAELVDSKFQDGVRAIGMILQDGLGMFHKSLHIKNSCQGIHLPDLINPCGRHLSRGFLDKPVIAASPARIQIGRALLRLVRHRIVEMDDSPSPSLLPVNDRKTHMFIKNQLCLVRCPDVHFRQYADYMFRRELYLVFLV